MEVGWALGGLPGSSPSAKSVTSNATQVDDKQDSRPGNQTEPNNIGRQMGVRAMSLGFSQARRRGPYRPTSVGS